MKKKILFAAVFMALLFFAPAFFLSAQTPARNSNNQFAALLLKVSEKDNKYTIEKGETKIVNGVYKTPRAAIDEGKENDLVCFILDERNTAVDSLLIPNPLSIRYEYPEDERNIGTAVMNKKENEIMVRFNYNPAMKYILIKRIGKDGSMAALATLTIM
ncbi:MAG TPA: hypothetical protein VI757_16260 [Bacteroidia bacterium]|nr:hypothetical protein [Bacteroidia bacterium]